MPHDPACPAGASSASTVGLTPTNAVTDTSKTITTAAAAATAASTTATTATSAASNGGSAATARCPLHPSELLLLSQEALLEGTQGSPGAEQVREALQLAGAFAFQFGGLDDPLLSGP